jgi:hypothetical protein
MNPTNDTPEELARSLERSSMRRWRRGEHAVAVSMKVLVNVLADGRIRVYTDGNDMGTYNTWAEAGAELIDEFKHRMEEPIVTKTGRVLTDTDIQALALEAERGYDVSELKKREKP